MRLPDTKKINKLTTLDKINKFLMEESLGFKRGTKPSNKPSMVGSKCFRKIYYSYFRTKEDSPPDSKMLRIFETGNIFEDMLVNWFKKIGEHIPYRNKTNGKIPITWGKPNPQFLIKSEKWRISRGYIDNVAIIDGELWLYEIKTSKAEKWIPLTEPMPDHYIQTGIYIQCFNDMSLSGEYAHIPEVTGKKAVGIKYFYINKNTTEIKEFSVRIENLVNLILDIDQKLEVANTFADEKTLPPKTEDYCFFCNWKKTCKKDMNPV